MKKEVCVNERLSGGSYQEDNYLLLLIMHLLFASSIFSLLVCVFPRKKVGEIKNFLNFFNCSDWSCSDIDRTKVSWAFHWAWCIMFKLSRKKKSKAFRCTFFILIIKIRRVGRRRWWAQLAVVSQAWHCLGPSSVEWWSSVVFTFSPQGMWFLTRN